MTSWLKTSQQTETEVFAVICPLEITENAAHSFKSTDRLEKSKGWTKIRSIKESPEDYTKKKVQRPEQRRAVCHAQYKNCLLGDFVHQNPGKCSIKLNSSPFNGGVTIAL
ncbi:hypothetical protein CEXT_313631 [Caerostris extrusa]|uniref:Uncharacterized protein n=1 Tax=Caerostris extrusa TaxID=172846 RepID=A0AAV4N1A4_CAEEX|nr:hypothetical protein CEXT_313631 [Caerostris extrusa]